MSDESNPSPGGWPTPSESEDLRRKSREVEGDLTVVYLLRHPETGAVGYIGAATKPIPQLSKNLFHARMGTRGALYSWLRSLLRLQLKPVLTPLAVVPKHEAAAQLAALKKTIGYTAPPRDTNRKPLKYPHDLTREATSDLPNYHDHRQANRDMRDPYIRQLKADLRKYGPKSTSTRISPLPYLLNPLEMELLDQRVRRAYLKSLACKKPWK